MIKKHPWRFAFTLLAALVLIRIVSIALPRTMPGAPQIEKCTEALVASFKERNDWIVRYYGRSQTDTPNSSFVLSEIKKADVLGTSILANVGESAKHAELKRDLVEYMKHQCNIAQRFGKPPNANNLWIHASYTRDSFNKTMDEETSIFRSMFGGKAIAPACPK